MNPDNGREHESALAQPPSSPSSPAGGSRQDEGGEPGERFAMRPMLYLITVPGLEVASDWRLVHDRLLDEFPEVTDVLATTMPETILVVDEAAGPVDTDRWLETVCETILHRRRTRLRPAGHARDPEQAR